jgi:hypothetical protein
MVTAFVKGWGPVFVNRSFVTLIYESGERYKTARLPLTISIALHPAIHIRSAVSDEPARVADEALSILTETVWPG